MFFDSPAEIEEIARRVGAAVFVMPDDVEVTIRGATILKPETKTVISIEQVQELIRKLNIKQIRDFFVVIRPAELLSEDAANALLKNLEEPSEKVHFVLVTSQPSKILPTILSRSAVYFLRTIFLIDGAVEADEEVKALAKKLIVARPFDLPDIANEITKKRDNVRAFTLNVLATTIEMLYKSYYITDKPVFLKKLPKFLTAYENIEKNGHIKLHLVADLI